MRKLGVLVLVCAPAFAQFSTTAYHVVYAASLPAKCNPNTGDIYFKTTSVVGPYYCSAANTWSSMGAGAVTGITSLNALVSTSQVFANDTNVTITSSGSTHQLGWTGTLAPARGGTGVANTATHTLGTANQNWATLGSGIVKNTTVTGALSIATPGTDYLAPTGSGASLVFPGTLVIASGKTLTANSTLTIAGTDGITMTTPTTSFTAARTDASNTFTGHQTIEGVTSTGATGTGNFVFSANPVFSGTVTFGALVVTTLNGNTITTGTGTLTIGAGKTLTVQNSITLAGTDGTTLTFQGTGTVMNRDSTDTMTGKTYDTASSGNVFKVNANQISAITGSGNTVVLSNSPNLATPNIGAATASALTVTGFTAGGPFCVHATSGVLSVTGTDCGSGGGGGVSSVAQSFTGGIVSVAGSPITTSGTLALTIAATSGGLVYGSDATHWAFSAAGSANAPVLWGGAGVQPGAGTRSGNTTTFATTSGTLTNGHCTQIDASGNVVDSGSANCGGGGSVTWQLATVTQGSGATFNIAAGTGITNALSVTGGTATYTPSLDTTVALTHALYQAGGDIYCASVNGTQAYTCNTAVALTAYTKGMHVLLFPDVSSTTTPSLSINNISSGTPVSIDMPNGSTAIGAGVVALQPIWLEYNGTVFVPTSQPFPNGATAGDLLIFNGSNWITCPGNTSGTNYLQENASGVCGWSSGTSTISWSSITAPSTNLTLAVAGNLSNFTTTTALADIFGWKNITPAISGTSQGSPDIRVCGRALHGSADVEDCMTLSELPGNGNDAAITFNIGHSGTSTGQVTTKFPGPVSTAVLSLPQGSANTAAANSVGFQAPTSVTSAFYFTLPGAPGAGLLRATNATPSVISAAELSGDATTSGSNAVTVVKVNGGSISGTNGNVASYGASNTFADAGFLATNVVRKDATNTWATGLQNMAAADYQAPTHSSDPGTCVVGQFEFNSTGAVFKGCLTTNNWTTFAASGAVTFDQVGSGVNTTATMTLGAGSSLTFSSTGVVNANQLNGTAFAGTSGHVVSFGAANIPADSGVVAANVVTASGTLASSNIMVGNGTKTAGTSALIISANTIANGTNTNSTALVGGADSASGPTLGNVTVRGGDISSGASASKAGNTILRGGNFGGTSATSLAGGVQITPGIATGATQGLQGLLFLQHSYVKGATVTQYNGECLSAAMTVTDCAATPTYVEGVADTVNSNTALLNKSPSESPINASAAVTLNDTVCWGSTAGQVTDSGGTAPCTHAQGPTAGTVIATSGTWTKPDGTTVAITTTLPLVAMVPAILLPPGGTVTSVTFTGDGTVLSSTPSSAVTTSGTVTAALANAGAGTLLGNNTGSSAAPIYTAAPVLGVDNATAGTLQLANGSSAAHTIWASGATTTNTIKGFTAVPTTGHLLDCSISSTTCTLHDSGVVTANVVNASAPGVGIGHFAGSTQTLTSSLIVAADITSGTITGTQIAASITLTTPNIGAATGTSLLATGIVDGEAPITLTTGSSATLGGTYNSGYTYNQEATAATAIVYTLPTAAAGKQYCIGNSYNGSAGTTGTLKLLTSASGQFIIYNGALSATNGFVISAGALGDKGCAVGVDSTHWEFYAQVGTWTLH